MLQPFQPRLQRLNLRFFLLQEEKETDEEWTEVAENLINAEEAQERHAD